MPEPEELEADENGVGRRAFRFVMDKPVAPYLIAMVLNSPTFQLR